MKKYLKLSHILFFTLAICLTFWAIVAIPSIQAKPAFWDVKRNFTHLSGILTIVFMSLVVILAWKKRWAEQKFGGLDKVYFVHKWLGISAGIFLVMHWISTQGLKLLAKYTTLLPARPPKPPKDPSVVQSLYEQLHGPAHVIGEYAGYAMAILIIIALMKKTFSYKTFRLSHKIFGVIFIAGALHSIYFLPQIYFDILFGFLVFAVAIIAVFPAVASIYGNIGKENRSEAKIKQYKFYADDKINEIVIEAPKWKGHRSGQFLFIRQKGDLTEGGHPFTIASFWNDKQKILRLGIKSLGDFTANENLKNVFAAGKSVKIEGPYGDFVFADNFAEQQQIWIATGIGMTPFVARLEELAAKNIQVNKKILFYFLTPKFSENAENSFAYKLKNLCQQTGVDLQILQDSQNQYFKAEMLAETLNKNKNSQIYFCGVFKLGESIENYLRQNGFVQIAETMQREKFEFR